VHPVIRRRVGTKLLEHERNHGDPPIVREHAFGYWCFLLA
jgi:hypothetical protein